MRLLCFVIFVSFSSILFAQVHTTEQLDKAIRFYHQNKYVKAERIIDRLLKSDDLNPVLYIWKAKLLMIYEEFDIAYEQLNLAEDLEPNSALLFNTYGDMKFQLANVAIQKPEVCGSCANQIIPQVYQHRQPKDFFKAAIKDYLLAEQYHCSEPSLHYKIGLCYDYLGDAVLCCKYMEIAASKAHQKARLFLSEQPCTLK